MRSVFIVSQSYVEKSEEFYVLVALVFSRRFTLLSFTAIVFRELASA